MDKPKNTEDRNPLDSVITYFLHCIWDDLLQIAILKTRKQGAVKKSVAAVKETSSKTLTEESLNALIILLLHCILVDLKYILKEYRTERVAYRPSPDRRMDKLLELIDQVQNVPTSVMKHLTIRTLRLIWLLTFSKVCIVHRVLSGSRKRIALDIVDLVDQLVIADEWEVECGSHKIKQMKMIVVTLLVILLQLCISKPATQHLAQLHTGAHAEIDCLPYTFTFVDLIPKVHFEHGLLFYQYKFKTSPPPNMNDHYENCTAVPLTSKMSLLYIINASSSNSTDAVGLKLSNHESKLSLLLSVCIIILKLVILSPVIVESMPTTNEVEKKPSLRKSRTDAKSFVVELKGSPNTGYCAEMTFGGVSDQQFCMLVDTGSANLAVAAKDLPEIKEHLDIQIASSTLVQTNHPVSVSYSGGEWSGTLATDLVSIGGSPQIEAQFALITSSSMFFIPGAPWVGILGLAYDKLAKPDSSVKSFWGVLQEFSGLKDVFALKLCPPINFVNQDGIMEFGDISDGLYVGSVLYTTIVQEMYYNVLVTNLTVGNTQIAITCSEFNNDKAIIDSGTTDIYLPSTVFTAVVKVFKRHFEENVPMVVPESFWSGSSKLAWPTTKKQSLLEAFPTVFIGFAEHVDPSSEFALAVTPQIYLRQISGSQQEREETNCLPECDFFVFGIKGREKGMVIGGNVMLGFTTIFDREQKRMGFARSSCKYGDTTPTHVPYIVGPYPRDPVDCACYGCSITLEYWEYITYSCGVIVAIVSILSIGYAIFKRCQKRRCTACIQVCCHRRYTLSSTEDSNLPATPPAVESEPSSISEDSGVDHSDKPIVCEEVGGGEAAMPVKERNLSLKESYVIPSIRKSGSEAVNSSITLPTICNNSPTYVPNGPATPNSSGKDTAPNMLPHNKLVKITVSVLTVVFSLLF